MLSAKKYPFYFQVFPLLIFLFVSACGTLPNQTAGTTPMDRKDVIKPCAQQFHPQTILKHTVTQAMAQRLYFLSGVHLYALNAGNGALHWCLLISNAQSHLSQEAAIFGAFSPAPPAPLDGLVGLAVQKNGVFVTTLNFSTYAFTADSGKMIWQHNTGFANGIPTISGDTIYVPSGTIYALSTQDGSERWSYPTQDVVTSIPVIINDTLYTGSYGKAVYALDTASGKARWIYHTDGRVYVAPSVDHGVVYAGIGDDGPRLFAIDAQSGKLIWHTNTFIDSMTQLVVADGLLYTSQNNSLVGLNPQNGKVMWHYSGIHGATLLANGHVLYATSDAGDLYAFETQTHTLIWHEKLRTLTAGEATRMKLIGDELYVGFNDLGQNQFASIHAINTQVGSEDWSAKVNWNVSALDLA
jgi:outer membrane protein assembly factor BamB